MNEFHVGDDVEYVGRCVSIKGFIKRVDDRGIAFIHTKSGLQGMAPIADLEPLRGKATWRY